MCGRSWEEAGRELAGSTEQVPVIVNTRPPPFLSNHHHVASQ